MSQRKERKERREKEKEKEKKERKTKEKILKKLKRLKWLKIEDKAQNAARPYMMQSLTKKISMVFPINTSECQTSI